MKKSKKSRRKGRTKTPVSRKVEGRGKGRRPTRWIVGGVLIAIVAIVLAVVLIPKTPRSPRQEAGSDGGTAGQETDDIALRDEAFEVARQLMADFPQSAFPIGLMGTVHNQFGNSEEAEKWWWQCLERDPTRADIYEVLAVAFLRKGEYEKVAYLSLKAQEVDPKMPGVHRRHAEALLELGRLDEALVEVEREMKITPRLNETHVVLGKICLQLEKYERAVAAYTRALELRPGDSRCYFGLANACARLGQSDKAREYMEKFTELRAAEDEASTTRRMATDEMRRAAPILAEILVDAGQVYNGNGRHQKAEQYWRRAAMLDPTNTACRTQLVELCRRTRRGQEALEMCEQLTRVDPENAYYHHMTGIVLAGLKRFAAAEQAIRKAIELAPERPEGYRSLAALLLRRNDRLPEAKSLAQKAVELAPTAAHYSLLSNACSRSQDRAGALAAMKRAAELAPDNDEIRRAYEMLQKEE